MFVHLSSPPVEDLIEIMKTGVEMIMTKLVSWGDGFRNDDGRSSGCAFHSTHLVEILLISIEHYGIHSGMNTFANNAF